MKLLQEAITKSVQSLYGVEVSTVDVTRPDAQFGDYASNIAMQLAKQLSKNPREIATALTEDLKSGNYTWLRSADVAGPGFINFFITDSALIEGINQPLDLTLKEKSFVVEYSCPNAFKELHAGHLYQTVVGDSISRILQAVGAEVHRTNFGGDVGLHVAKAVYGIICLLEGENPQKLSDIEQSKRAQFLSSAYVLGAKAYEENDENKQQIGVYNKQVYEVQELDDHETNFAQIYWTCRQWSYDYFDDFYKRIEVESFKYYPESVCTPVGIELVNRALEKGIFIKSDGAVIYPEEKSGLHTRVFITGGGLPTYETKDLGVISLEHDDYSFDHRLLLTGRDQIEYMKVVFSAAGELIPGVKNNMTHITNGIVKFGDGKKMSSRLGNVTTAVDVVETVLEAVKQNNDNQANMVMLGAVKYEFLKHKLGGDISFNPEESVSLQGNSGPYLQYAHARARSILAKAPTVVTSLETVDNLDEYERILAQKLTEYTEVVEKSAKEYMPHYICTYLYELAQAFNRFYENSKVVGHEREAIRVTLVARYADILKNGLALLGIEAPDRM